MNTPNIDGFQAEYNRQLQYFQPVEAVYQAERAQEDLGRDKYDTVFHHFMYDYVGGMQNSGMAPLMLREHEGLGVINYSNRMYLGFTDSGKILLVRCSSEVSMDKPEQFYIATADLEVGQVSTWSVHELVSRDQNGFECYMENQDGSEAHLELGTQKVRLAVAGSRRPEGVAVLDKTFFDLLETRRRLHDAPKVGKLLLFMANPYNIMVNEEPATIAA